MKAIAVLIMLLAGSVARAQTTPDEAAIRSILDEEITTWNQGDTDGYSRHFASDGTFTNVPGMFFTGRQAFRDRHEVIFRGPFRGTKLQLQVVSLRFLKPDVAICETLSWVRTLRAAPRQAFISMRKGGFALACCRLCKSEVVTGRSWSTTM